MGGVTQKPLCPSSCLLSPPRGQSPEGAAQPGPEERAKSHRDQRQEHGCPPPPVSTLTCLGSCLSHAATPSSLSFQRVPRSTHGRAQQPRPQARVKGRRNVPPPPRLPALGARSRVLELGSDTGRRAGWLRPPRRTGLSPAGPARRPPWWPVCSQGQGPGLATTSRSLPSCEAPRQPGPGPRRPTAVSGQRKLAKASNKVKTGGSSVTITHVQVLKSSFFKCLM